MMTTTLPRSAQPDPPVVFQTSCSCPGGRSTLLCGGSALATRARSSTRFRPFKGPVLSGARVSVARVFNQFTRTMSALDSHSDAISGTFDAFECCGEDSVPTTEDAQWSSESLELATHAVMARHAGRLAHSTDSTLIELHLKFVAELYFKCKCGPNEYASNQDEFLRESLLAMRALWSNTACGNPQQTLAETKWGAIGVLGNKNPSPAAQALMFTLLNNVRGEDETCDSVVDAGFDLLDGITRRARGVADHHPSETASTHYEFGDTVLWMLSAIAFHDRKSPGRDKAFDGDTDDGDTDDGDTDGGDERTSASSKKATMLRATQTLLTYVTPSPSDPPCARRAMAMIAAGVMDGLMLQIDTLSSSRARARRGDETEERDDGRRESGASELATTSTFVMVAEKRTIQKEGHASAEDDAEEDTDTVRDAVENQNHPLDDTRLQTCLALAARVLQLHANACRVLPACLTSKLPTFLATLSRVIRGPTRFCFSAGEKRKALAAMTHLARFEYEPSDFSNGEGNFSDGGLQEVYAAMTSTALIGWHLYIRETCGLEKQQQIASCSSAAEKRALERDFDCTFRENMNHAVHDVGNFRDEFRKDSCYDTRLTATDVGPCLCDVAGLFQPCGDVQHTESFKCWFDTAIPDSNMGTDDWVGKLTKCRALTSNARDALQALTLLATSRGSYSEGCPQVWHAKCAHAGAVLRAVLSVRGKKLSLGLSGDSKQKLPQLPGAITNLNLADEEQTKRKETPVGFPRAKRPRIANGAAETAGKRRSRRNADDTMRYSVRVTGKYQ